MKGHNKNNPVKKVLEDCWEREKILKIVLGGLGIIELEHLKY